MKKILFFLMMLAAMIPAALQAQEIVEIFGTDSTTSTYLPAYTLYSYNLSEQIYTADEVGSPGIISSIAFYNTGTTKTMDWQIYLVNTDQSEFASTTDWLTVTDNDLVFTGSVTLTSGQWTTIQFDNVFDYEGSNLGVVVVEHMQWSSGLSCSAFTSTTNCSMYVRQDASAYNPIGATYTATSRYSIKNKIKLEISPSFVTCPKPTTLTVSNIMPNEATLAWTDEAGTGNYILQYKKNTQDWEDDEVMTEYTSSLEFNLSGLVAATQYNVRVASICGSETSSWRTANFVTACDLVTELPFTEGFESAWIEVQEFGQTNSAPNCWTVYNGGMTDNSSSNRQWKWSQGATAHTGSNAAQCYTDYAPDTDPSHHNDWLITPQISLTGNQMLSFYAQRSSNTTSEPDEISIWISDEDVELSAPESDTAALPGFTQLVQYDLPVGAWQLYEVPMEGYSGNRYIAFVRRYAPNNGFYLRVDDVVIDEIPSCTRPAMLAEEDLTTTSVNLTWESNATNFILYYKALNDTAYTVVTDIYDTEYFMDIHSGDRYTWYVSALCDDDTLTCTIPRTFLTPCESIETVPVTWGFEAPNIAGSTSYPLPACWDRIGNANFPYAYSYSTYAHNGTYSLYSGANPANFIAILPQVNTDQLNINELQLRFYARMSAAAVNHACIEVGVMTDPADASSFEVVDSVSKNTTNALTATHKVFEVPLTDYEGRGAYIALRLNASYTSSTSSAYIYIDDVTLENTPMCSRPDSLHVSNIEAHSGEVSWVSDGTDFNIYYKTPNATQYTLANDDPVTEMPYTITDLAASTTYQVLVANICADGSEVIANQPTSFTTLCDVYVAPYTENFTGFNTSMSPCWERDSGLVANVFAGGSPHPYTAGWIFTNSDVYPLGHPKVNVWGSGCKYWLVTPSLDLSELTEPALTFNLALTDYGNENPIENVGNQADDKFMVIVSTDNGATWSADNATVWDNTAEGDYVYDAISNTGDDIVIPLSQYADNIIKIAFYVESTVSGGDNDLHIANVHVGEMPSCTRPNGVALASVTATEATITWNGEEGASYQVAYDTTGFDLYGDDVTIWDASENSILLDGLEANTAYDVYVRTVCGDGYSIWTEKFEFRTPCTAFVVTDDEPFVENFNTLTSGIPNCWDNSEGTTTTASYKWNYYSSGQTGACVRFNSYTNTNGNTNMLKTPVLDLSALSTPMLSFSYKNPTGGDFSVYLSTDGGATYPTVIATGLTGASDWTEGQYILSELENTETVVIVFKGTSNYGPSGAYIDLDNVEVGPTAGCLRPANVTLSSLSSDEATITWSSVIEGSNLELYYKEHSESEYTTVYASEFIDEYSYQMTGLTPATTYDVYVAALCDDDTLASDVLTFVTSCVAIDDLPYIENFNSYTTTVSSTTAPSNYPNDVTPTCWSFINKSATSGTYPQVFLTSSTTYAVSGNCLFFKSSASTPIYAVLPSFTEALQNLQITFSYRNEGTTSSNGILSLGYMTNVSDVNSFVEISSFPRIATITEETVVLNTIPDSVMEANLVFKYTGGDYNNYFVSIDNVVVEIIPTCPKPTDLSVTAVSDNSVSLSWTAGGDEPTWEIAYGTPGFNPDTVTPVSNISSTTYQVTGLNNTTTYEFYVRANCGGGDVSTWSNSVEASTNMTAVDLPYSTDFSTPDWKLNNGTCVNKWKIGVPADSTNAALFITSNGSAPGYENSYSVVTAEKMFNMPAADSINVTFDVYAGGESSFDYLKVFLAPSTVEYEASNASTAPTYAGNSYSENAMNFAAYMSQTAGSQTYTYKLNRTIGRLHIDLNMANPSPNGQAKLVFLWKNDGTVNTYQPGAIIENVTIQEAEDIPVTCNAPTNVTATEVTKNSAVIDWEQEGTPDSWTISYKKESVDTWTTVENLTSHPYTLTDLEPNTWYNVNVKAVCGTTTSEASSTISFQTLVDGVNEYVNSTVLYPNPTTGQFTIYNEQCTIENVEVYDIYGKLLNSVEVNDNKAVLDVTGYASGIYFTRIYTDKGVVVKQIVKK